MSIQSEINRIAGAKSDIADAIEGNGVTVPSGTKLDGMANLIGQISGGSEKLNSTQAADAYDPTATYAVGDKVSYAGNVYSCISAISTPEAWDSTHWDQVDPIQDQVDDVRNTLNALEDDVVGENPISIAGTNTTGTTIKKGTFFYNNGELVYAKSDIANNDGITIGTNAENASTDGALNTLSSPLYSVKSSIEANSTVTITSSSSKYTISNTFLKHSFYLIRGNVCYVNLVFDCVTPATSSEAIFSNMPMPLAASDNTANIGHAQCWDYPDLVGPTIIVQNKILYLRGGTANRTFGLSFSYLVDV